MDYTIQFVCPDAPKKNRANMKSQHINPNSPACRNLFSEFTQVSEEPVQKKSRVMRKQKSHVIFKVEDSQTIGVNETFKSFIKELHTLCEKYLDEK